MSKAVEKVLFIMIVVTLAISLAACGSTSQPLKKDPGKQPGKPTVLTLWHQWVDEAGPNTNSLKNAIKEWNDKKCSIEVQAVGYRGEQYKTKIKTALAAGEAPDLFYMWGGSFVEPYIRTGNILPLDSYLDEGTKGKLMPRALEACTFDGKIYSLPLFTFIASLYCNKVLFDKAGVKIPSTYDELLKAVKALRAAGITPAVVGEKDRWPGAYWFDILAMRQAGSQACMDALNHPSLFDHKDFIAAARKLSELVKANAFNYNAFDTDYLEMINEFRSGNAAMLYQGNWVDIFIENSSVSTSGKVIAVPFPVIPDGKGSPAEFLGGNVDSFYINIDTKNKVEAVRILEFISEKAGKEGYLNGSGLPCWKTEELDSPKQLSLAKQSAKLMSGGKSFVGWWDTILPAADSEVHSNLVAELFAGKISPEEFADEMVKMKGETYVKSYKIY